MIIDFLNKFDFFKIFLVIFNNIENNHKKDFILLAVKFLIATFLELFLIIFSGSLIYIFLGDNSNKDIIEVPKYLSSLGINEFTSIKFIILFIVLALFSTIFSFYVKYEAIHVSNNISNHVNTNLIKTFLNIQYDKYT